MNGRIARASRVVIGDFGRFEAEAPPPAPEGLIGADEVEAPAPAHAEPPLTLEEIIDQAEKDAAEISTEEGAEDVVGEARRAGAG